jgi:hypothetical protein
MKTVLVVDTQTPTSLASISGNIFYLNSYGDLMSVCENSLIVVYRVGRPEHVSKSTEIRRKL